MLILDTHTYVIALDNPAYPTITNLTADWVQHAVTVDQLVPMMDEAGVTRATLIQALQAHGYDNSYTIDSAARFPGRFTAVGMYDPLALETAAKLRDEATNRGMRGARINPRDLNNPETFATWQVAAELNIPILIAVARPNAYPAIEELAQRFPGVRVVLEGLGLADEQYDGPPFAKQLPLFDLALHANIYLKWCTDQLVDLPNVDWQQQFLLKLVDTFGATRMMWGSRYPYRHEPDWTYASQVQAALVAIAKLSERDQQFVMGEAALALWPDLA